MHSDPVSDMLTRIRNGGRARHERIDISFSSLKLRIAEVLKQEGFIEDFRSISGKTPGQGVIEIELKYDYLRAPVIIGLKRVSHPSARQYLGVADLNKVRNGLGILILTTPKGVMTDRAARQARVGGEVLCAVW